MKYFRTAYHIKIYVVEKKFSCSTGRSGLHCRSWSRRTRTHRYKRGFVKRAGGFVSVPAAFGFGFSGRRGNRSVVF